MNMEITIEHKRKKYVVKEPTIKLWSEVMQLRELHGEEEMYLRLLEKLTDLTRDELIKTDAKVIRRIGEQLQNLMTTGNKELIPVIDFKDKKYGLIDVNKISFGQFVDIDSFLQKNEQYRIANLNELAAYLYTEIGTEYKDKNFKDEIEKFKDLPVRYIEGSLFFLSHLGKTLVELIQVYSQNKWKWKMMKTKILLVNIGVGIQQLVNLPKTKFGRLMMLLLCPLWLVLTICLILWTLIKNKKKD